MFNYNTLQLSNNAITVNSMSSIIFLYLVPDGLGHFQVLDGRVDDARFVQPGGVLLHGVASYFLHLNKDQKRFDKTVRLEFSNKVQEIKRSRSVTFFVKVLKLEQKSRKIQNQGIEARGRNFFVQASKLLQNYSTDRNRLF
jgi:hypothetical protein